MCTKKKKQTQNNIILTYFHKHMQYLRILNTHVPETTPITNKAAHLLFIFK